MPTLIKKYSAVLILVVGTLILSGLILNSYFFQHKKESEFSVNTLSGCRDDIDNCLKNTIPTLLNKYSLKEVMDGIGQNLNDKDVFLMCHEYRITRELGFDAAQSSNNFKQTLSSCDGPCYEACYHGVTEAFVAKKLKTHDENYLKICGNEKDYDSKNKYLACVYGVGRALMRTSKNDLPSALNSCDDYENSMEREDCYAGVFGENSQQDTGSKYFNPNDLNYPCNAISDKYQKTCYGFQGRYYMDANNEDLKKGVGFCQSIPSQYVYGCIKQVAGNLVYTESPTELSKECSSLDDSIQGTCVASVSSYIIQRDPGNLNDVKLFCSQVPSKYQNQCVTTD